MGGILFFSYRNDKLSFMIDQFPKDGVTFCCQGNYFLRQRLFEKAEIAYKKAIELTPNYHYIHFEYARCLP